MDCIITIKGKKYKLVEENEDILVPKEIQFTKAVADCGMGLLFNKRKQELCWYKNSEVYVIDDRYVGLCTPKLTPCEKEDIGIGEWGYRSDSNHPDFENKTQYSLRINKKVSIYISEDEYIHRACNFKYYWKVSEKM